MEIKSKFNIGDPIYLIQQVTEYEKCDVCEKGSITLKGRKYLCPECHGSGSHTKHDDNFNLLFKWVITGCEDYIEDIPLEVAQEKAEINYISEIKIDVCSELPIMITYGVNFIDVEGNLDTNFYSEYDCFKTVSEALAECKRRNENIRSSYVSKN